IGVNEIHSYCIPARLTSKVLDTFHKLFLQTIYKHKSLSLFVHHGANSGDGAKLRLVIELLRKGDEIFDAASFSPLKIAEKVLNLRKSLGPNVLSKVDIEQSLTLACLLQAVKIKEQALQELSQYCKEQTKADSTYQAKNKCVKSILRELNTKITYAK